MSSFFNYSLPEVQKRETANFIKEESDEHSESSSKTEEAILENSKA